MSLNLLEKTELWVSDVTLDQANLTEMAAAVARVLGLQEDKVMVVDVRSSHITFDITEKEVQEEAGFSVISEKIIAVQDWRKHNVVNYAYGVVKIFVLCRYEGGEFEKNIETTEIGFFDKNNLPSDLAVEKCTKEQILMCFDSYENPNAATLFY